MKIKWRKLLAWSLSAALLFTAPGMTLCAEEPETESAGTGLCEHHTEHDESCGYREASEEIPCTCGYDPSGESDGGESTGAETETDTGTDAGTGTEAGAGTDTEAGAGADAGAGTEADAGTDTEAGAGTETRPDGHAKDCAYRPADPGSPCTFACSVCHPQEDPASGTDPDRTPGGEPGASADPSESPDGGADSQDPAPDETSPEGEPALLSGEPDDVSASGLVWTYASVLPKEETVYTAGDGTITWKPVLEGEKVVRGQLVLHDARIDGGTTASLGASDITTGIWVPVSTEILLEGTNRITIGNSSGKPVTGIYLNDITNSDLLDITIRGEGSLEMDIQGDGIVTGGSITVENAGQLTVIYGEESQGGYGLNVTGLNAPITIRDSRVTVKSRDGMTGQSDGAIRHQNLGNVVIENSHAVLSNGTGPALRTAGELRLLSSEVHAIGNTSTNFASSTLNYTRLTMEGGCAYLENRGSDEVLPLVRNRNFLAQGAVLYRAARAANYDLFLQGDGVQYTGCYYDIVSDQVIAVGNAHVFGNVTWNENIRFSGSTILNVGIYADAVLTIPEGMTVDIPAGCTIYNRSNTAGPYSGTFINAGTLNILNGGTLQNHFNENVLINQGTLNAASGGKIYNFYDKTGQKGGIFQNQGSIRLASGSLFQNQACLENSGSIASEGSSLYTIQLTGYGGVINNTGTIDGFIIEWNDAGYTYASSGQTALSSRQMLTLTTDNGEGKRIALRIDDGTRFTIGTGAIVDARTNLTKENLSQYLTIDGELVVNGQLRLPEDPPEELLETLAEHISGTGTVLIGSGPDAARYIVSVSGSSASASGAGLYQEGDTISIDAGMRAGYRFKGWKVSGDAVLADASAAKTTFLMPKGSVTVTAEWEVLVDRIELDRISLSLLPGDRTALQVTFYPSDASNQTVSWISDHPEIVSVDPDGNVTAVSPGTAMITATAADGGKTVSCLIRVRDVQELPDPPADTEETLFKLILEEGLADIPQALRDRGLDTQEKIETALKLEISRKQSGLSDTNTALYDVTLLVRREGSSLWEIADASNFPSNGRLQVILPYPEGTGRTTHDFFAAHMFTTSDFGKTPGAVELPEVTKTGEGLRLEVTGLSPILLTWREVSRPGGGSGNGSGSHSSSSSSSKSSGSAAPSQPAPTGAATGDTQPLWIWIVTALFSCGCLAAAGTYTVRKKRNML